MSDITAGVSLGHGWKSTEYHGSTHWRWMGETATVRVPASPDGGSFILLGYRCLDNFEGNKLYVSGPRGETAHEARLGYNIAVVRRSDVCGDGAQSINLRIAREHKPGYGVMVFEITTTDAIRANGSDAQNYYTTGVSLKDRDDLQRLIGLAHHMAAHSTAALMTLFNLFHYEFPKPPRDPLSKEYRRFWRDQYAEICGAEYSLNNEAHNFDEKQMENIFPYCTNDPKVIGEQLIAVGSLIRSMHLPSGASILEMGVGWGNTALQLGLSGYDCTVLDIEPKYLEIVRRRFAKEGLPVKTILGDFFEIEKLDQTFDAVLFFECFHHCDDHLRLLDAVSKRLKPGGRIVFAGEPISNKLPYPWGLNPAGQGIWTIAHHGWLELCFREDYFLDMLRSRGFEISAFDCPQTAAGRVLVAQTVSKAGRKLTGDRHKH
ncbi:class I SAM-dependent methyltransferase [Rhizobium sp. IMFF44]|uniref:class I SAM-dependent methyltransferase n=1 Tax=Rhizobium sp. IMFF44 TaxID=3342350 RepID=UPI0035B87727